MNEKTIKKELGFLIERYGLSYLQANFETDAFWVTTMLMETYSFYNKHGCFTIAHLCPSADVYFLYFNKIGAVRDWVLSDDYHKHRKAEVNIESVDTKIWDKHRKSSLFGDLFWGYGKRYFNALAEVIEHQIETTGQFFGVKVTK